MKRIFPAVFVPVLVASLALAQDAPSKSNTPEQAMKEGPKAAVVALFSSVSKLNAAEAEMFFDMDALCEKILTDQGVEVDKSDRQAWNQQVTELKDAFLDKFMDDMMTELDDMADDTARLRQLLEEKVTADTATVGIAGKTSFKLARKEGLWKIVDVVRPKDDQAAAGKKPKHPWGSFKVGSFVKIKRTTKYAGSENVVEFKRTLEKLDEECATVRVELRQPEIDISTRQQDERFSLDDTGPVGVGSRLPHKKLGRGKETLTVAGKELACTWIEIKLEFGERATIVKTWTSEEVPGFVVKMVSKSSPEPALELIEEVVEFSVSGDEGKGSGSKDKPR